MHSVELRSARLCSVVRVCSAMVVFDPHGPSASMHVCMQDFFSWLMGLVILEPSIIFEVVPQQY